jgi:hypothetical protein
MPVGADLSLVRYLEVAFTIFERKLLAGLSAGEPVIGEFAFAREPSFALEVRYRPVLCGLAFAHLLFCIGG